MKLSLISDLHLREREPLDKPEFKLRLDEKLEVLRAFVKQSIESQVDRAYFLGDIFHTAEPKDWLKALFFKEIKKLLIKKIPVYIVLGNHDGTLQHHSLESLKELGLKNINIIETPEIELFQDFKICYLPYRPVEEIVKFLESHNVNEEDTYVFGHIHINGAEQGNHQIKINTILEPALFSRCPLVVMGHIHKRQSGKLAHGGSWTYLGSPVYQDFGEASDPAKAWMELTINEENYGMETLLSKPTVLRNVLIEEETSDTPTIDLESNSMIYEGEHVKITFKGKASWLDSKEVKEAKDTIKEYNKLERFGRLIIDTVCTDRELIKEEIEDEVSLDESVKKYCEVTNKPDHLGLGLELLEEAFNEIE